MSPFRFLLLLYCFLAQAYSPELGRFASRTSLTRTSTYLQLADHHGKGVSPTGAPPDTKVAGYGLEMPNDVTKVKICECMCNGRTFYSLVDSNEGTCDDVCKQNMGQNCDGEDYPEVCVDCVRFYIVKDSIPGQCPCDHHDLGVTLPEGSGFVLRIGFGGGGAPGQYPKPGPKDEELCVLNEKWRAHPVHVGHGSGAG